MPASLSPSELHLTSISFFGRAWSEYLSFFALTPAVLAGRRVLDVAAGPSSFAAEARDRGLDVVAVDPLYGLAADALAAHVQIDYGHMFAEMRRKPELLRFRHFPSVDAAETERRAAADRFLADYLGGFAQGRYVGGRLPRLPFGDASFDLVLCAHLLFVYAQRFDFAWHLAACRELARVSAGEVRIHPICGLGGRVYPELAQLRRELARLGVASRVAKVDYEFFRGTDATLILNPAQGAERESVETPRALGAS
jgi:SAM-dependent methyltransferase